MTDSPTPLPRVTIQFCTQCKWMLRAAYFAQELLSTFSTSLGEVALQPSTGGTFIVNLYIAAPTLSSTKDGEVSIQKHLLWDRKAEGGFPETKELKRRVRDIIDPNRDLGHVDGKKATSSQPTSQEPSTSNTTSHSSTVASSSSATDPAPLTQTSLPRVINRLQTQDSTPSATAEKKSTPTDIDASSRPSSSGGILTPQTQSSPVTAAPPEKEILNSRGKIQIGGDEGFGFCKPGEDCEDCG